MNPNGPFRQEVLNRIFSISKKHPDRLLSRESGWLEFKESFGFQSVGKYIRTAAAFANAGGGYIVYGVASSPHKLIGLKDDKFNELDPEKLTSFLNEHFDPEIRWDRHLYELEGKLFGLLHFRESINKPTICRKGTDDGKSLKEGEIYYRYSGRTQTIRYAELKELIEQRRKAEQLLWFKHLKEIARIGIQDSAIFDLHTGKVSGTGGHLFIDESLLSQVSFIREGEFKERTGKPTLKIIGEARVTNHPLAGDSVKAQIIKTKGIRAPDIILGFLRSDHLLEPQSYLTQICYESTAFLPFYFLLEQCRLSIPEASKIIGNEPSTQAAKSKLIERIRDDSSLGIPVPNASTEAGVRKLKARSMVQNKKASVQSDIRALTDILVMIRTIQAEEMDSSYIKKLLHQVFTKHYGQGHSALNDHIRRAVCYVDYLFYRPAAETRGKAKAAHAGTEHA